MRRFAQLQLRSSLPVARTCRPLASRLYSTRGENVDTNTAKDQIESESSALDKGEEDGFAFGFDTWSEVNPDEKTIETAVGSLPISPLLDPSWRRARQRQKKRRPDESRHNRFQRRMKENPYAQLLAEPVRSCHITRTRLPKSFLQDFGLVKRPGADELWWIPGDFEQTPERTPRKAAPQASEDIEAPAADAADDAVCSEPAPHDPAPAEPQRSMPPANNDEVAAGDPAVTQQEPTTRQNGRFFAPAHVLARQDLLLEFFNKKSKYSFSYMKFASNPAIGKLANAATWRQDMHEVIRDQMRRQITDELIYLSRLCEEAGRDYLIGMDSVQDVRRYQHKSCYLSLGEGGREPFDALEIEGVEGSALPVYALPSLLGPESFEHLKSEASLFRNVSMLVLKGQRTVKLNKKLWRLQGFVAEYDKLR